MSKRTNVNRKLRYFDGSEPDRPDRGYSDYVEKSKSSKDEQPEPDDDPPPTNQK